MNVLRLKRQSEPALLDLARPFCQITRQPVATVQTGCLSLGWVAAALWVRLIPCDTKPLQFLVQPELERNHRCLKGVTFGKPCHGVFEALGAHHRRGVRLAAAEEGINAAANGHHLSSHAGDFIRDLLYRQGFVAELDFDQVGEPVLCFQEAAVAGADLGERSAAPIASLRRNGP